MGKVVGLVGAASGKIGNLVYAVTNGIQTARVYQPIINNPKSNGQRLQRAKGNLAGRMSSFVPSTAIKGLGNNNRIRRGEFLRNILKNADTQYVDGTYEAKINPALVLFSKGNVILPVTLQTVTAASHLVSVALYGVADTIIAPEIYASRVVRLVAMVYDSTTSDLVEVSTKIATMPAQSGNATTSIPVAKAGGYEVFVYAIPMSTEGGSAAAIDTSVVGLDDDDIAASLSVNGNNVVFNYGRSVYLGEATYTPA